MKNKLEINAGRFKVLSKPKNVISDIADAARTCYKSFKNKSKETDKKLVKKLIERGHHAMLEMSDIKVRFMNVSRGFTHEMVRHRLASYAQESTRYVDQKGLSVVFPPHKKNKEEIDISKEKVNLMDKFYSFLRNVKGWKPEDARQFLPIGLSNEIVVKANVREWRHIFTMRCDKFAHWEIRSLMLDLLFWCKRYIPLVFDDFKFFTSKETGQQYARPIMSKNKIFDILDHAIISREISEEDLQNFIYGVKND